MRTSKTVYVVRQGMNGGYMSDSLAFFATKRDAQGYMINLKYEALDEDYKVTGSARDGWYALMPSDSSENTLGNSIILDSVNADMYRANLSAQFETMDELVDHLNQHYS